MPFRRFQVHPIVLGASPIGQPTLSKHNAEWRSWLSLAMWRAIVAQKIVGVCKPKLKMNL